MAFVCAKAVLLAAVMLASAAQLCMGARRRMELYRPDPADMLSYHNGAVLHGDIAVSVLWYGSFKPAQKAVILDFLLSLTAEPQAASPSVAQWWSTIDQQYLSPASAKSNGAGEKTRVLLADQLSDGACSMGKSLTLEQITALAATASPKKGGVAVVFTAQDVAVEGFGGSSDAPLEAATACPGIFGNGAYPGYAGDLKVDQATGASYNCNGAHGRKYLLPALYDPSKSACGTLV
ncbi:unnamed protein product [Triticum turgidum subsp. durum]|uniref:Uncharacterized protein n=1 Tax=Triticum turgidum subsp. durum TaxID=4567 RepID=A0A9R0Y7W3_TRITD|nr:unnamed protein product [Triticum turgidum subsp. durum]